MHGACTSESRASVYSQANTPQQAAPRSTPLLPLSTARSSLDWAELDRAARLADGESEFGQGWWDRRGLRSAGHVRSYYHAVGYSTKELAKGTCACRLIGFHSGASAYHFHNSFSDYRAWIFSCVGASAV